MKKVIITGATGMIGISLIKYLLTKNIQIIAIVRENSNRISNIPKDKNVKIIECSLENLKKLQLKEKGYEIFYHFAWDGTFGDDRNNKEKQERNVQYTLDSLKLAKRVGCKRFIGAGSQAEFGRVNGIINEEVIANPETEYGKAKLMAGMESKKLANELKIEHIWTRIFSCYGPYDGKNTMIMTSIREMLEGKSPNYTKGEQNWNYIFSEDLAKIFYYLGDKGVDNSLYCLASTENKKLYEYIKIIRDLINTKIQLKFGAIAYSEKQVMNLTVDIQKLINDIGYQPETLFEDGIRKTIEWYRGFKR